MDIRKVKKLIELLDETGVAEIEIKEGEESVRISRHPTGATYAMMPQHMSYGPPPAPAAAPAAPGAPAAAPAPAADSASCPGPKPAADTSGSRARLREAIQPRTRSGR